MGLWDKYRYAIKLEFDNSEDCFVTRIDNESREFEYHTELEIKSDPERLNVMTFSEKQAIDLMNRMFVNGYRVMVMPWFAEW